MKYSILIVDQIKEFEEECQKFLKDKNFKLMYRVYDKDDILCVDGDLYDILNYGHADYNFGSELARKIDDLLSSLGVIMENQGGGVFKFYEV